MPHETAIPIPDPLPLGFGRGRRRYHPVVDVASALGGTPAAMAASVAAAADDIGDVVPFAVGEVGDLDASGGGDFPDSVSGSEQSGGDPGPLRRVDRLDEPEKPRTPRTKRRQSKNKAKPEELGKKGVDTPSSASDDVGVRPRSWYVQRGLRPPE